MQDVVLSHFHYDHTTGLMALRSEVAKRDPRALSRVHVGKGIFLERRGSMQNPMIAMKKEYEATGGAFVEHDKPEELQPGVWVTGPVPRVFLEKNYPKGVEVTKGNGWVEDDVPDDQSLIFNTSRGLVLLTGCGHAGIVNTLEYARQKVREARVHAVLGGIHLFEANAETLAWTAAKLRPMAVEMPGSSSGLVLSRRPSVDFISSMQLTSSLIGLRIS